MKKGLCCLIDPDQDFALTLQESGVGLQQFEHHVYRVALFKKVLAAYEVASQLHPEVWMTWDCNDLSVSSSIDPSRREEVQQLADPVSILPVEEFGVPAVEYGLGDLIGTGHQLRLDLFLRTLPIPLRSIRLVLRVEMSTDLEVFERVVANESFGQDALDVLQSIPDRKVCGHTLRPSIEVVEVIRIAPHHDDLPHVIHMLAARAVGILLVPPTAGTVDATLISAGGSSAVTFGREDGPPHVTDLLGTVDHCSPFRTG